MKQQSESTETPKPKKDHGRPTPPRAWAAIIAATLCWSSNAVAVKLIVRDFPQVTVAGLRIGLAALTLAIFYIARGGEFRLRWGEARPFLWLGSLGLALSFLCFTVGLYYTSVSHAVLVGALVPVMVLLLAWMEGQERINYAKLGAFLLGLFGVLLLVWDRPAGQDPSWKGDLIVIGGVCSFAFFTVRSKKIAAAYDPLRFNTFAFLAAGLCFAPWLLLALPGLALADVSWVGWSSLLYSGTIGSAGAYLAYYYALRQMKASAVAVFHYVQPVLAALLGVWLFQEPLTARFGIAAALILTGVFLAERQ